jgi:4-carboxymuconolactone decarboxylase
MTSRLPLLDPKDMNADQRAVYDDIMSGARGSIQGPFNPWLRSPGLADPAQKLGEYCRFNTILGPRLTEIAILLTARHWKSQFEWYAHANLARDAGHTEQTIAAIKAGERPAFDSDKEGLVFDYTRELIADGRTSDETHARALDLLSEQGVVELVGVIGYYMLVSLTLNAFHVPLPDGVTRPFADGPPAESRAAV